MKRLSPSRPPRPAHDPAPQRRGGRPVRRAATAPGAPSWSSDLEPGFRIRLQAAADSLGLQLMPVQADALMGYLRLLHRWAQVHNLTAIDDPSAMLVQHVFDSLAIVPLAQRWRPEGGVMLDVGSGAGLPGVVVAIAAPRWTVACIDRVDKKVGFVRQVALELGLANLHAMHGRVESLGATGLGSAARDWRQLAPQGADLVVSRAFASLSDFVSLSRRSLGLGGAWLAMKGRPPDQELDVLRAARLGGEALEVFHVEPLHVPELQAERCAVWIRPLAEAAERAA